MFGIGRAGSVLLAARGGVALASPAVAARAARFGLALDGACASCSGGLGRVLGVGSAARLHTAVASFAGTHRGLLLGGTGFGGLRRIGGRAAVRRASDSAKKEGATEITALQAAREGRRTSGQQARQNVHNQGASGIFLYPTSFADRGVLVLAGKYAPFKAPMEVGRGVMNMAYSRVRILMSTIVFFWLLYYIEMAIRSGRFARDGGEESIYRDDAAMQLQAEKRAVNMGVGDGSHNGGMLRELSHAANDRTDILAVPAATTPAPAGSAAPAATERLKTIGK